MKKAIILSMVSLIMLVVISGCTSKDERDFNIENHNWTFSNMVDNEKGEIVVCSEAEQELYQDAKVLNLTCKASTNILAIKDAASGNGAEIGYRASGKDTNSLIYELVYQNGDETIEGMAVSSITEYAKGEFEYTLVVDFDGYTLYFVDKAE